MRRWLMCGVLIVTVALTGLPVSAHAVLDRALPAPNATLHTAPTEIRLWFTEPLEAQFSTVRLLDGTGTPVAATRVAVAADDPHQLVVTLYTPLSEGVYTVAWQTLSAADGHTSEGSYGFSVGMETAAAGTQRAVAVERADPFDAALRWANLLSLSLLVGGTAFALMVWQPTVQTLSGSGGDGAALSGAQRRLSRALWGAWALVGAAGVLLFLHNLAGAAGAAFASADSLNALDAFVRETRTGSLWGVRLLAWLTLGAALALAAQQAAAVWRGAALALGCMLLLAHALYGHASAVADGGASLAGHWLHLTMTAFWFGGLAFVALMFAPARAAGALPMLLGQFSNMARVALAVLVVTGAYAMWLQVGSVEALTATLYGQALVIKLILFAPILLLAAVNFLVTRAAVRGQGRAGWTRRLRLLVGAEAALLVGVLAAVGVMTGANPARQAYAQALAPAAAAPFEQMIMEGDLHLHLSITPNAAGINRFQMLVTTMDGEPITDVSRLRLRLRPAATSGVGESELRLMPGDEPGVYTAEGANLSLPGAWRVRATVARAGAFDTLADFEPLVAAAQPPAPSAVPRPDERTFALLVTGMASLAVGGLALAWVVTMERERRSAAALALAGLVVLVGALFVVRGALPFG